MSAILGEKIKICIFGESHGRSIGGVLDGMPSGEKVSYDEIKLHMKRRMPEVSEISTVRYEPDNIKFLSGIVDGYTTGTPIAFEIDNVNHNFDEYSKFNYIPRPGHADFAAYAKYGKHVDLRGGGHFSGRLTAPIVCAGSIVRQMLERKGIQLASHIYSIGDIYDDALNVICVDEDIMKRLQSETFPVISVDKKELMLEAILSAKEEGDSIGGIIECMITGVLAGIGNPIFDGLESKFAHAMLSIPGVKGIDFGSGFDGARMRGSENNDPFTWQDGEVLTTKNDHGGILSGISTGMPIYFKVAIKPTPSIKKEQRTVNFSNYKQETIKVTGRHDPSIVSRVAVVVESLAALVLGDSM